MNKKEALIQKGLEQQAVVKAIKKAGLSIEIKNEQEIIDHYRKGKNQIKVVPKKGESMDTCATISEKYICCNVKVLKSVSNCPYDCSYCFLQNYLNDGSLKVVGDEKALINEVKEKCKAEPKRLFRIGTWELGDSLALEHQTGQAQRLIEEFTKIPNAILELKTKSDCVDPILNCNHQQKTVVSWSLNSNYIVEQQEHKTARLHQRLNAIKKVMKAGYLIGLHFDPMILHPNWKEEYKDLINKVFSFLNPKQIAWISVGTLRFNPEMKKKMEENFPKSAITAEEMVLGDDGKMRYVKPVRLQMYDHFFNCLQKELKITDLSPTTSFNINKPLIYYCMERWDIWEHTFGSHPKSIQELDYFFAKSFYERYPDSFNINPDIINFT